jgi:hypothetical protein
MKISTMLGLMAVGVGFASAPAHARGAAAGRWTGLLLRDGVQVPIAVELSDASGRLQVQDTTAAIQGVRVSAAMVHFEVPGEGVFDGTFAGNSMAGSVTGTAAGSFSLAREAETAAYDPIGSFGP